MGQKWQREKQTKHLQGEKRNQQVERTLLNIPMKFHTFTYIGLNLKKQVTIFLQQQKQWTKRCVAGTPKRLWERPRDMLQ